MYKTNNRYQKDYETYWTKPFLGGDQKIFIVGGNCDSSDFSTSLSTLYKVGKFSCYSQLAESLFEMEEDLDEVMEIIDSSYTDSYIPDDEHELRQDVKNCTNSLELFNVITKAMDTDFDPCTFVRGDDPLFLWLKDKRF